MSGSWLERDVSRLDIALRTVSELHLTCAQLRPILPFRPYQAQQAQMMLPYPV